MRTILALALVACALGIPGAPRAAELTFAIDGAVEYDSNVFRSHRDEKDDFIFRLRPWVRLDEQRGQDLTYSLTYALPAEFAVEHTEVDDVDQELNGSIGYSVNDRFDLFASNTFRYLRSELRTNFDGTESAFDSPLINDQRDRVAVNDAIAGAHYQFTPRLGGGMEMSHSYFDPSRDDRQENWQIQGIGNLLYTVTPKHRAGGGVSVAHQKFYDSTDIVGSEAQIYNVFGTWRWSIDEKTELGVSAGPAVIYSQQDDADATRVRNWIPFQRINGDFTAPAGFIEIDGSAASPLPYTGGVLLVSQFDDCPELQGNPPGQRVLVGDTSCSPSVVIPLTGVDASVAQAILDGTSTVTNPDPDGETSTDVTVFADFVLTRHWTPNVHTAFHYAREQGNASGLGGTVISDSVTVSNTWQITEKWQLAARGEWGLRQSLSEQGQVNTTVAEVDPDAAFTPPPVGGPTPVRLAGLSALDGGNGFSFTQRDDTTDIDTMRWGFASRVTRFFTRNTSGYVQFTYNQQGSQDDSLGDPSDFEDYLVTLGVQHVFSPIKLW